MLPVALVPVRLTPLAKRRLAHKLPAAERTGLVLALFNRVVAALQGAGLDVVALAPHDVDVPDGVELWIDEAPGLNGAIGRAVERTGIPVMVVHADLPDVTAADVTSVLSIPGDVVIARARDGGTNVLLLRSKLRPSFGPNSALLHAQRARAAGLRTIVVDHPGLALDVDDAAGLTASSSPASSLLTSSSRRPLP
jgi:2-phospho-L-lactate guanylyltransferase